MTNTENNSGETSRNIDRETLRWNWVALLEADKSTTRPPIQDPNYLVTPPFPDYTPI